MLHIRNRVLCFLALAIAATNCFAQNPEPAKFYKLDFVVKEVEAGKVLNARSYWVTISVDNNCSIRTGSKVPVPTTPAVGTAQFTYLDVGVNIDCLHMKEVQNGLSLGVNADVSSVLQESTTPSNVLPIVRQNKWSSTVIVPLKKPTVIFSSDDLTTKHQMQLELTATPIT
jgi:hypothetical protein